MLSFRLAPPRFTATVPELSLNRPIAVRLFTSKVGLKGNAVRAEVFEFSSLCKYLISMIVCDWGNQSQTTVATLLSPSVSVAVSGVSFGPTPHSVHVFGR